MKQITIGVFENNKQAYYCYKAAGFQDVLQENPEICELFGEKWKVLELSLDREDYLGRSFV